MADSEDDAKEASPPAQAPEATPPEARSEPVAAAQDVSQTFGGTPAAGSDPGAGPEETAAVSPEDIAAVTPIEPPTPRDRGDGGGGDGPRRPPSRTFAPGDVLAERYLIVRFIAQGAMGEVYEAEDRALRGRVALKTVRPDIASDAQAVERFKREIALARLVTHPNVSRVYDLGVHRVSGGDERVLFLTMELLQGETLTSLLLRRRRLKRTEALPILKQIAAGLDAAHAVGVIHRDFKSGNVMLVPSGDRRKSVRAVVTDFGLARGLDLGSDLESLSGSGTVMGTPAYMAPEQVEGLAVTPAADIYALGIVAYEMMAGTRPFDSGGALAVAVQRLKEAPVSPRIHVPDLHPAWEVGILRCLEIDPTARPATAGDFVRALETPSTTVDVADVPTKRVRLPISKAWSRLAIGSLVAAAVLALALLWRAARPTPFVPRRALAVVGLRNATGSPADAWYSTAIGEMVATDLAAGGALRALPPVEVARAKADLGIPETEPVGRDHANALHARLGADLLLSGTYTLTVGSSPRLLRLDLRLQDGANGQELAQGVATGNEGQLFDLVFRATAPLRERLGVGRVPPAEALEVESVLPANQEAARLYAQGVGLLRQADAQGAVTHLEKAASLAPKHPLPQAVLATAWTALGYEKKAREAATQAAGLSGALPAEMRAGIEARLYEAEKDWGRAIDAYRALVARYPDDLDYGLKLAEVQTLGGKAKEALVSIDELRKRPVPASRDPRIDLAHARAFQEMGDPKQALAMASEAARKGANSGTKAILAHALALESRALQTLGEQKASVDAAEEARKLFEETGDTGWIARCLELMAIGVRAQGDLQGARLLYERALAVHRSIGDLGSVARVLHNLAEDSFRQGKSAESQKLYDEALETFQKIDAKLEAAVTLLNLGARLQTAGDLAGAQRRYQQGLGLFQEIGERTGTAHCLTNLGEVYFARGDLDQSHRLHEESLAINREIGDKAGAGYDLFRLGDVAAARGDLRVARKRYEESLALHKEVGDELAAAQTRVGLAALALADQRAAEAESLARESEEFLRSAGAVDIHALSLVILGESLLAQGKAAESKETSDRVAAVVATSLDLGARLASIALAARLRARSHEVEDVTAASRSLAKALADATRVGLVPGQYEVRLALGQIEIEAGQSAAGRARLQALVQEARAKGFGLIAKRAEKSIGS